jgi:uncharacterized Ntn-hydrolase superfamily protein
MADPTDEQARTLLEVMWDEFRMMADAGNVDAVAACWQSVAERLIAALRSAEERGAQREQQAALKVMQKIRGLAGYVSVVDPRASSRLEGIDGVASAFIQARSKGEG